MFIIGKYFLNRKHKTKKATKQVTTSNILAYLHSYVKRRVMSNFFKSKIKFLSWELFFFFHWKYLEHLPRDILSHNRTDAIARRACGFHLLSIVSNPAVLSRCLLCMRLVDTCKFAVNEMNASSVFGRMVTVNGDCFVFSLLIASLVSPELFMAPPCPASGLTWRSGTLQVCASHPRHWLPSPYPFSLMGPPACDSLQARVWGTLFLLFQNTCFYTYYDKHKLLFKLTCNSYNTKFILQ